MAECSRTDRARVKRKLSRPAVSRSIFEGGCSMGRDFRIVPRGARTSRSKALQEFSYSPFMIGCVVGSGACFWLRKKWN